MVDRRNSSSDAEALRLFDEVYENTHPDVSAYCRRRAASVEDANDAVAEVYVVAWRRIDELVAVARPVAWLIAVSRGVLSNQRRSQARQRRLIDRLISRRPRLSLDPAAVFNTAIEEAYAVLAALPALDQELIVLATLEGLTYDEISRVLKQRPAVVRTQLYRARKRFKRRLDAKRSREQHQQPDTQHDERGSEGAEPPESHDGGTR